MFVLWGFGGFARGWGVDRIFGAGGRQDARLSGVRRWVAGLLAGGLVVGCASPGPPKAPSLQLPEPVKDLSVARQGGRVELRFTLPQRTTDDLPIRQGAVKVSVCRGGEGAPCVPVGALKDISMATDANASAASRAVVWHDELPEAERTGAARLLVYRVELSNLQGKTAGWSDPAYAAAGTAPEGVAGLRAEETRAGILLRWQGAAGTAKDEVLLRREIVIPPAGAKREAAEPVWLVANAGAADETIDGSAEEDTAYRYAAVRRRVTELGGQKVELRSALSSEVEITWRNAFPPAAPVGLSAAPYAEGGAFAVDLVWEPVEEPGLKGYVVTRQELDASGAAVGAAEKLTAEPVGLPAFHDASAKQGVGYRYGVRAVSKKGVVGAEATVVVGR